MTCSGLAIRGKLEGFQLKGHLIHTSFSIHRRAICLQDISPEIPLEEESVSDEEEQTASRHQSEQQKSAKKNISQCYVE